jgi:hypothetical protein
MCWNLKRLRKFIKVINLKITLHQKQQNITTFSSKQLDNPHVNIEIHIISSKQKDRRIYNKPTTDEVAAIITGFGESDKPTKREAYVFSKNGSVKSINVNHRSYDALMYPLMFPFGTDNWAPNTIRLSLSAPPKKRSKNKKANKSVCRPGLSQ